MLIPQTCWRRFWFKPRILSRHSFVALDSWQSVKVTNTWLMNLAVATMWVRFAWRVWHFYSPGKRVAKWSRCALTFICRQNTYMQCVWFFEHRWEKIGVMLIKQIGHVFYQIFLSWHFWVDLPVEINNPVPASQKISTIPCHWTLLRRRQQQA